MEEQNGNISFHKPKKTGFKGKPPYSVETPYGFRIDLDFLKYVDDIEKGNTIKRVPVQRRSKGPRASTLPRHLNTSGNGYRSTLWGSTGALGPRSRLTDAHHSQSHSSSACDHRLQLSPTGLKSLSEMEARIKEFDEQPLGEHIRPHLLRASSLPLTVLLRQTSESTDDAASLRSSRDHLDGRNTSCESIFYSANSPQPRECSGMPRCLSEALEHVRELEMEVRVIPELRAQIRFLQEERERLRHGLNPQVYSSTMNGTTNHGTFSCYSIMDVKRPRHESHVMFPKSHKASHDDLHSSQEWRTSTDLDELLTVTSLQAKVAVLEQKLHETGLELQRALGLLKEQQEEGKRKDERIENLVRNPAVWVRAERVTVDQDGDENVVRTSEQEYNDKEFSSKGLDTIFVSKPSEKISSASDRSGQTSDADTVVVVYHIKKIKRLLEQQWEYLCANSKSGEESKLLTQQDSKVSSLQQEMMGLIDILASYYTQNRKNDEEMITPKACKSIMKTDGCTQTSKSQHSVDVNEGCKNVASAVGKESVSDSSTQCFSPRDTHAAQVDTGSEKKRQESESQMSPDTQMTSGKSGSGWTDGNVASAEAEVSQKMAKSKTKSGGEQMERFSLQETPTGGESVSADFMAACHFLNDHMENMDNPNDDMRKALVVLFQHWFGAAAEEASVASRVSVYLREVKKSTPSLLAFLVNLADDNGNTVLHYSVSHCNYGIVSQLLDTGVSDLNLQNNAGYTAVMLASLTAPDGPGGMEVVRKIMELGNINVRSSQTGQTALHLAVRHGRVVMVRLLLSCGADTNIQDSQGNTALMFAAERGHTHIARLLLERSQCDLTLTDKRGQTAISIAMRGSHTDTAALLQAHAKARVL